MVNSNELMVADYTTGMLMRFLQLKGLLGLCPDLRDGIIAELRRRGIQVVE